ncbi:hypothetical protein RND71_007907 [Anisodus tanguticus]|uniref:Uncharacterized protein n=1 Tax=Anisodus tanguticus TaxID=243964 RepID=A0AAE1SJU1_9SOLA|nr:hypothetical protein RND71_007907 [Anisodus tanguticus]
MEIYLGHVGLNKTFCYKLAVKPQSVFKEIADTILLQHLGAIVKFNLDVSGVRLSSYAHIDKWMLYVTRNGVKELYLHMSDNSTYNLPSYVLYCPTLTRLDLYDCVFKPPNSFVGFRHLIIIRLERITFVPTTEFCVINCPLLVNLALMYCRGIQHLNIIVSSQLEYLIVHECPCLDLNPFINCKKLRKLQLEIDEVVDNLNPNSKHHERSTLEKLLLSVVPTLEFLQMGLGYLEVSDSNNTEAVLNYLDRPTCLDLPLNKLKYVVIDSYECSKTELLFVKLLLARAPSLVRMYIEQEKVIDSSEDRNVVKELMCFPRASPSIFRIRKLSQRALHMLENKDITYCQSDRRKSYRDSEHDRVLHWSAPDRCTRFVSSSPDEVSGVWVRGIWVNGVLVNGALHWLATEDSDYSPVIAAFDLSKEKFLEVPTPSTLYKGKHVMNNLVALRGCLSMSSDTKENRTFWMMKDYGVEESWGKFEVKGPDLVELIPLCLMSEDDIVLDACGQLIVYNVRGDQWRDIMVDGIPIHNLFVDTPNLFRSPSSYLLRPKETYACNSEVITNLIPENQPERPAVVRPKLPSPPFTRQTNTLTIPLPPCPLNHRACTPHSSFFPVFAKPRALNSSPESDRPACYSGPLEHLQEFGG